MGTRPEYFSARIRKAASPAGLVFAVLFAGLIGYTVLFVLPRLIGS